MAHDFLRPRFNYLLDQQSPVGQFHFNRSDIQHYFNLGDAIEYSSIHVGGSLPTLVMVSRYCDYTYRRNRKTSRLLDGESGFGLIGESVSPRFDFADMQMG